MNVRSHVHDSRLGTMLKTLESIMDKLQILKDNLICTDHGIACCDNMAGDLRKHVVTLTSAVTTRQPV